MPPIELPSDPDPDITPKSPYRQGGGGPGGPGPGPGGGFASFGGSGFYNPLSGGAPRGGGMSRQAKLRRTMMGGMLTGDNIPAWLSEGEFVMNPFSAEMFGPELEQMNAMGNMAQGVPQEYAYGGPVRSPFDEAEGYGFGGWLKKNAGWLAPLAIAAPFAAPAIAGALGGGAAAGGAAGAAGAGAAIASGPAAGLSIGPMAAVPAAAHTSSPFLLSHTGIGGALSAARQYGPSIAQAGMDQYGQGQARNQADIDAAMQFYMQGRGYATGGWAQPSPFGKRQFGPTNPGSASVTTGGMTQRPAGYQQQTQGNFTLPGIGSSGLDPRGFVGSYDPRNPWAQRTGTQNPGGLGDLHRLIGQWGQGGAYTPGGDPRANAAMREAAVSDARAYGDQAYLGADVGGLDPAAAQAFRLQAMSNAGRGVGDAMTRYRADSATRDQDFARQLLMSLISGEQQSNLRSQDLAGAMRLKK